jgi:Zn-dependent protease with chaperone function
VPAVYILDDEPAINSFAAGLTTSDAVVTVTRGTLEKLSRDELQGVIAHEFSHILNGDMRMNVRVSAIIFGILVIGLAGRATLWGMRYGGVLFAGARATASSWCSGSGWPSSSSATPGISSGS